MARMHKKHTPTGDEIDLTTFMNLMVILISSLLLSATFTRLNGAHVDRTGNKTSTALEAVAPALQLDIFVYPDRFVVDNRGKETIGTITFASGKPDYNQLNIMIRKLKSSYPKIDQAMLRVAENVPYDEVIGAMDATRMVVSDQTGSVYPLFPEIQVASLEGTS